MDKNLLKQIAISAVVALVVAIWVAPMVKRMLGQGETFEGFNDEIYIEDELND